MNEKIQQSIQRGIEHLLSLQHEDGHFEGKLSSNTYPTCAYGLVQLALDSALDSKLIEWLLAKQNDDGTWGLDAAPGSDREATLFAKLILKQAQTTQKSMRIDDALKTSPDIPLHLFLIKYAYACCGEISWGELLAPKSMGYILKLMQLLKHILPTSILSRLKVPTHIAPPVDIFFTSTFRDLFIAEQYTLVPVLIVIELNTQKRADRIEALLTWLKKHRLSDGSWFCVNYITALSVLALIEAQKHGYGNAESHQMIEEGLQWLERTRHPDGGCSEALNLNIWDTALSIITLLDMGVSRDDDVIRKACNWLIENQNWDGGWAFSGLVKIEGYVNLPSDADDSALATLALLKSGLSASHGAVSRGLDWLRQHQGKDGSWGTYVLGAGDVGCVSITAHAIEACLIAEGMEYEKRRAVLWLKKNMKKDGYWSDLWLAKNTYGTACALSALIKAGERDCPEVEKGVNWLQYTQNADGGWGEDMFGNPTKSTVEQTAWSTCVLLLVDKNSTSAKRGIEFLLNAQREDGSWKPSCVGIYWEVIGGYVDPIYSAVFPLLALREG